MNITHTHTHITHTRVLHVCSVVKSCLTLCDPVDYSSPGSSAHGISQARILEWVAISFSRGSSWSREWTHISCLAGGFFTTEAPRKLMEYYSAMQRRKACPSATTWMNLEDMMLSGISKSFTHRTREQNSGCQGLGEWGNGKIIVTRYELSFIRWISSEDLLCS